MHFHPYAAGAMRLTQPQTLAQTATALRSLAATVQAARNAAKTSIEPHVSVVLPLLEIARALPASETPTLAEVNAVRAAVEAIETADRLRTTHAPMSLNEFRPLARAWIATFIASTDDAGVIAACGALRDVLGVDAFAA